MSRDENGETALERRVREAHEHNAQLKRELRGYAIREAGYELDSPRGRAIARLYDGPHDVDSVREFVASEFPEWSTKQ